MHARTEGSTSHHNYPSPGHRPPSNQLLRRECEHLYCQVTCCQSRRPGLRSPFSDPRQDSLIWYPREECLLRDCPQSPRPRSKSRPDLVLSYRLSSSSNSCLHPPTRCCHAPGIRGSFGPTRVADLKAWAWQGTWTNGALVWCSWYQALTRVERKHLRDTRTFLSFFSSIVFSCSSNKTWPRNLQTDIHDNHTRTCFALQPI